MRKLLTKEIAVTAACVFVLSGCGNTSDTVAENTAAEESAEETSEGSAAEETAAENDNTSEENTEVRKVVVGYYQNGGPANCQTGEDGNPTGYYIDALRAVDEALDEYEFVFEGTDEQDLWTGISEGKYQLGAANCFYTEERAEKYLIPEENIGACIAGILVRKEDENITSLEEAADAGFTLAPITAGDGWQFVVQNYNEAHPDKQIAIELTDSKTASNDGYGYVAEGRYDCHGTIKTKFESAVAAEDGDLHELYYDKIVFQPCLAVRVVTLVNKDEAELCDAINGAIKQLKDDGTLSELAIQYYGEDVFEYDVY